MRMARCSCTIHGPPRYRLAILRDKFTATRTRREKRLGSRFTGTARMKGIRTARGHLIPRPRSTGSLLFPPRRAYTRLALLLRFEREFAFWSISIMGGGGFGRRIRLILYIQFWIFKDLNVSKRKERGGNDERLLIF